MDLAIICGVIVPNDAISSAVVAQAEALSAMDGVSSVTVFAQAIHRELSVEHEVVTSSWSLAANPRFRACQVSIFHWGIGYELFDAITLAGTPALPVAIIHFHNCPPANLVPVAQRPKIEASHRQIHHALSLKARLWTYSEFNRLTLVEWGADPSDIGFVPIAIDAPTDLAISKDPSRMACLTVGRITPAKGHDVLIDAIARIEPSVRERLQLRIVTSSRFNDHEFVAKLREEIQRLDLAGIIEFVEDADGPDLWKMYGEADILVSPSLHEGLCVPIVEAYLAGCRVVATDAGNLRYIVQHPDPIVPAGDAAALAAALTQVVEEIETEVSHDDRCATAVAEAYSSANCVRHLSIQLGLARLDGKDRQPITEAWPRRRNDPQ